MPLLTPGAVTPAQRTILNHPDTWLVACFCAGWCDTCRQYQPKLEALAQVRAGPIYCWIDIEDHPDFLGDEDIDNFPTLLIAIGGRPLFYGPLLPHISHLERLLDTLSAQSPPVTTRLPNIARMLTA